MKDPRIRVEGEHGTLMGIGLWHLISKIMHEGEFAYTGDMTIYLDDVEVEKPIEMEDVEKEEKA